MLASTGGWPASAELVASAKADLVPEYLYEEVLARVGPKLVALLARFAVVHGGDDENLSSPAGERWSVAELVASVPLVQRSADGSAVLHVLWEPALRRTSSEDDAADACVLAGAVHRRRGRFGSAVELFAEAREWGGVVGVLRDAERALATPAAPSPEFERWVHLLPEPLRTEPEALLAAGLELQPRAPRASLVRFAAAAKGFRERGDDEGELGVISHEGVVRWWLNDVDGLLLLYGRVGDPAAAGSRRAQRLGVIGMAALAHLQGDSATVLALLADVDALTRAGSRSSGGSAASRTAWW